MKREGTIGAATFLAIAAVVGFSLQSGPKPNDDAQAHRGGVVKRSKPALTRKAPDGSPGCRNLQDQLQEFLEISNLNLPGKCYEPDDPRRTQPPRDLGEITSKLKFVIAMLPDPIHTHLPVLFDQFAGAIQEGAQDEKYDFDSSWLPWDEEETAYALFADEKTSNLEKELKENQPGIILFRKPRNCDESAGATQNDCKEQWPLPAKNQGEAASNSYREGLVVFVVGEDATHGIHREQFRNALAWITTLRPNTEGEHTAILGPTFSGSLPSLAQLLHENEINEKLVLYGARDQKRLAIYSGSVSSNRSAMVFRNTFDQELAFHSFVQNDDEILRRFCNYMKTEQHGFDPSLLAIISEDETAYGHSGIRPEKSETDPDAGNSCRDKALNLYYPRDISALRGAYQTKSLFNDGTSTQPADTQRRNLPTDLADPAGKVHDSIRSYGGNQTPLTQEAFLMEIVAALRELRTRYVILRSSNTLDQLFLTNFLRRSYPDGRIVILGSDLMFIRERGSTGLNGAMTLSTYPLFPLERDWTEHQAVTAADRVFSADTTEGTYVAFRLLLNDKSLTEGKADPSRCHVRDIEEETIFLPAIACGRDTPIPDYSPPFWMLSNPCGEMKKGATGEDCPYPGPATWLSVIGVNRFWPLASLAQETPTPPMHHTRPDAAPKSRERATLRKAEPGGRPEMPLGMKAFLIFMIGLSLFHAWCCWSGSFTAKPAFRAHFASTGDWRHTFLVLAGSCCIAFSAIVTGWGCGVFSRAIAGLAYPWFALGCVTFVCLIAWLAIVGNSLTARKLSQDLPFDVDGPRMTDKAFTTWKYLTSGILIYAIAVFLIFFVVPLERALLPENRVLTYWRAMHLASGVSPLVPIFSILIGLYFSFWFTLHGLALFGPDRPCLPPMRLLAIKDDTGIDKGFLRMFSQEDAAKKIEEAARPLNWGTAIITLSLGVLFLVVARIIARGVPVRSLGAQDYAVIFLAGLVFCFSLSIAEAWRFYHLWNELKRLLTFLDRLPLRRTFAVLRGFSWESVWKMSGNVLEVRYKLISRQMECMNHTMATLQESALRSSIPEDTQVLKTCLNSLTAMRGAGVTFAEWYSINYANVRVGDLTSFKEFQKSIASASGTLLTQLLVPAWRKEKQSLVSSAAIDEKEEGTPKPPPQANDEHIRNAEEFVCLNYLGFIQNVVGRLRTMAMTIMVLFLLSTVAASTYPFDPRQPLSAVLIAVFVFVGAVIVKVYAEMHRDATLSHVTNTRPGQLGAEFWFKITTFGLAPVLGLLVRIFPGISDFVFSWLQPSISSLK